MFCPVCRAEYREGFTVCSDCRAALVAKLPEWSGPQAYVTLWTGENADFAERLLEELNKSELAAFRVPMEVLLRNSVDPYTLRKGPKFGFAVCVARTNLLETARILKKFREQESSAGDAAAESILADTGRDGMPPEFPLYWDSATATIELWSGENEEGARFILDSLHGVGIPTRFLQEGKSFYRLMIRPEDEDRGREIVREIAENSAPEVSLFRPLDAMWREDPVGSYAYLWLIACIDLLLVLLGILGSSPHYGTPRLIDVLGGLASFAGNIGALWMLYQAIRYEVHPLKFIIIAALPFSFVWYSIERYAKRRGVHRLPIAVRMRMSSLPPA
jgi:hypothetical protein